jgi:hypothetical protein
VLITALIEAAAGQTPVKVEIDPVFLRHGLDVIGYVSPQFQSTLSRLVGQQNAAAISALQPYTLIIRNAGAISPVVKVVVRYPRRNEKGVMVEGSIPFKIGDDISEALPLGASTVLTPEGLVNQVLNGRGGAMTIDAAMNQSRASFQERFAASRFSDASVVLDLVIFADGGFIGADVSNQITTEVGLFNVEEQFLALLKDASVPDGQVLQHLSDAYAARLLRDASTQPAVRMYKGGLAFALSDVIKKQGRAGAVDWIGRVRSHKVAGTSLHRLE